MPAILRVIIYSSRSHSYCLNLLVIFYSLRTYITFPDLDVRKIKNDIIKQRTKIHMHSYLEFSSSVVTSLTMKELRLQKLLNSKIFTHYAT